MARQRIVISGRVQGVGFRYHAQEAAWRLDLLGWIRNLRGGRQVELLIEGPDDTVATFVRWCHEGPPHAQVESVDVTDDEGDDPLKPFAILPSP